MEDIKKQSASAKCYDKKIKNDADFYEKEKKRVAEYMKNRYATDEEYRQRVMEQKKASYHRRKQIILNASQIQVN
jgi:hypothetical protein